MDESTDPYVVNWSERVAGLIEMAHEEQDWYDTVAASVIETGDRVAVDIGCGAGGMSAALAAGLGNGGQVLAVDAEPELLAAVRALVAGRVGVELAVVEPVTANLDTGLDPVREALAGQPADVVWASASVHHVGDQQATVDALVGLLRPGGRLALAEGGLFARHLPWDVGVGEPGLELRLELANDRWFARMRAGLPGSLRMPYGWTETLRRAGLAEVTTRSLLRERPAPLPAPQRRRLAERLTRWVERLRETNLLDSADLAAWSRLLDPRRPEWLGNRTDLYRLDARSVHIGILPVG